MATSFWAIAARVRHSTLASNPLVASTGSKHDPTLLPSCLSHGWSMAGSAPTNSQFAGVLAGFVFTAVTILIARPGPRNTQALGLLSCAFVVLGFDCYLFSNVAGGAADNDCARIWAEGVPASGMLAVGGLAVVTGISWLLAAREETESIVAAPQSTSEAPREDPEPHETAPKPVPAARENPVSNAIAAQRAGITWGLMDLDRLSRVMAFAVAIAVALLLGATVIDYGKFAFGGRDSHSLLVTAVVTTVSVVLASGGLMVLRRHLPEKVISGKIPAVAFWLASYGTLGYAVACTAFVGYIGNLTADEAAVAQMAVLLGLIAPSILLTALVHSVAPRRLPGRAADTDHGPKNAYAPDAQILEGSVAEQIPEPVDVEPAQTAQHAVLDAAKQHR